MINRIHALLHRPDKGWDPVSPQYAAHNSEIEWNQGVRESLLDELDRWVGGLAGRRVLDLGGGPGHYSVAFGKRKANVTWHDVSRAYCEIAQRKASEQNVRIAFSIGYMEEASKVHREPFDLVFSRICWYYGRGDRNFANVIFDLVKPGGVGYVDTTHSNLRASGVSWSTEVRTWLNDQLGIKIGHPLPPHGRIAKLFMAKPVTKILVDYSSPGNDQVFFVKDVNAGGPRE